MREKPVTTMSTTMSTDKYNLSQKKARKNVVKGNYKLDKSDKVVTRSQTRKNGGKTGKRNREEESPEKSSEKPFNKFAEPVNPLQGLTLTRNGKSVIVDEKLLERLLPVTEVPVAATPFKDSPCFLETVKNSSPLPLESLDKWSQNVNTDKMSGIMKEILADLPLDWLARQRSATQEDNWEYSTKVSGIPKIADQHGWGNCWIQAFSNYMRRLLMQKYSIDHKFELSVAYICFYDKIERSNMFLEYMWTFKDKDLNDRELFMLIKPSSHFLSDGGYHNYFINLIEKYGIVPRNLYCPSFNGLVSYYLNESLFTIINHMAYDFRQKHKNKKVTRAGFEKYKSQCMKIIYDLVVRFLGEPPKPSEKFTWSYRDEHGGMRSMPNLTPEKFYRTIIPHNLGTKVCLIHDPRHPETYFLPSYSEFSVNMAGGMPKMSVNLPLSILKKSVYESLKNDIPVWFSCDIGKCFDSEANTADRDRFDYTKVLGADIIYDKADMLNMLTSVPNHAMLFVGCDVTENSEGEVTKYKKWQVENSWGMDGDIEDVPDSGFMRMTDSYFDQFVYEAVVDINFIEKGIAKTILDNIKSGKSFTYGPYDGFGIVARHSQCKCCQKPAAKNFK